MNEGFREDPPRIYKNTLQGALVAEFFVPEISGVKPAVIVVHGGGWVSRSGDMKMVCRAIASAGFVAVNITYRLSPASRFPAAVEDVRDAISWVKANAGEFEIDPTRLAGWGYSAGANLILLAGLSPVTGLKAIVAGGTPADLTEWPRSREVKSFVGGPLAEKKIAWEQASPVNHVEKKSPPTFLYHGKRDWIVNLGQMKKMEAALRAKKVEVSTFVAAYLGHLTTYFLSRKSVTLGIEFLKTKLS